MKIFRISLLIAVAIFPLYAMASGDEINECYFFKDKDLKTSTGHVAVWNSSLGYASEWVASGNDIGKPYFDTLFISTYKVENGSPDISINSLAAFNILNVRTNQESNKGRPNDFYLYINDFVGNSLQIEARADQSKQLKCINDLCYWRLQGIYVLSLSKLRTQAFPELKNSGIGMPVEDLEGTFDSSVEKTVVENGFTECDFNVSE